jgi:N-acetylneuraminic acid mutarotase
VALSHEPGCVVLGVVALLGLPAAAADWRSHAPLPIPRTEVAAATVAGRIIVVGGYLGNGSSTNEVDVYSPSSNSWRRGPNLPAQVNHAAATTSGGLLYVLGGYGAERSGFVLNGSRWRRLTLPAKRAAAGAAAIRGTVYVVGGVGPAGLARTTLAYDTKRRRWHTVPGPTPREHLAVAAARGRIYAIAGRTRGLDTNLELVESWAPGERRWRREAPVPDARGGTGAAVVGRTIVSVGGEAIGGTIPTVYGYDVVRRSWRRLDDLPTPRHGLGVTSYRGSVYVIGGGPEPGLFVSGANESLALG